MKMAYMSFALALLVLISPSWAGDSPAPAGAKVYIIWPGDGEVISGGKLWLRMGLKGAGISPAGIEHPHTGHHHVLIDTELPPFDEPIPFDKNHVHFGAGQSEARIELSPGTHTLQVLLADHDHVPHNPPLFSERITVFVP